MKTYVIHKTAPQGFKIDYQTELNERQLEAVKWSQGPALVLAGAGSGKTRTITYRTAYLAESGVNPENILMLTFTNKAAREMTGRIEQLLGGSLAITSGTFHHVGNRILRRYAPKLDYPNNFTIIDSEDAKDLMDACRSQAGIDVKSQRFPKNSTLVSLLSKAINTESSIRDIIMREYPSYMLVQDDIEKVIKFYLQHKKQLGMMDYDDLLLNWLRLLREHPDVGTRLAQQYQYIMVDEYQDTNKIQGDIIDRLAAAHKNLMVVGDDAQSIYAFRGANYENILQFPERYPDCKVFKLETNYRSTPQICDLANTCIKFNERQFQKDLYATRSAGELPALIATATAKAQAEFIAQRILELRETNVSMEQMACLYRSHYQSLELQLELTKRGIPFVIRSGLRFFEQAHVKDTLSFLKVLYNPKDEVSWKRLLKLFPRVGGQTAHKIWLALFESADPVGDMGSGKLIKQFKLKQHQALQDVFASLHRLGLNASPAQHLDAVFSDFYRQYIDEKFENPRERKEDLNQLMVFSRQYLAVTDFLAELSLLGELGGEDVEKEAIEDKEKVVLSTIHRAKGLEWEEVFLLWTAQYHFPSAQSLVNQDALEEERRLFYVAVTRAKNMLYMIYPQFNSYGDSREVILRPSQFVEELGANLYEEWQITEALAPRQELRREIDASYDDPELRYIPFEEGC